MIGYVTIGVSDMENAKNFYTELFAAEEAKVLMDAGRIAFIGKDRAAPMLAVCTPHNGEVCTSGNGGMLAFPAGNKDNVQVMYDKAISLGATDEGEPGQRVPDFFYGAYVRDPDGNKLCFYVMG
ncbi:VOC family protein [Phaeobacter gallaeciensis]|jgi:predicted lactoylglutathione lyase|uniref:VOC family protein n=1 Tax=Rhodobacterales TaxID=204455 RepID=UPI00237F7870|nr:VOC family protein [Phaeobacter gallaeciensis]MDE4097510.1 VOC family protein [Phaeobacter gallaeciensis]MDE4105976.1 VOC family protein [Phaeobacter gallaeciensis]MDE4110774.1 VOC family protein [Phaeobacter gallaeciensis]MDE4115245.1 VOC family protein [Phaeobacter gallaeciensis]MDE4119714.1 VOC family protein [Phaeobacter gallaeciensis]